MKEEFLILKDINLDNLFFLRPEWFYAFIPLGLIVLLMFISKNKEEKWQQSISPKLRKYVVVKNTSLWTYINRVVFILFFSVLIISISGPSWKQIEKPGAKLKSRFYVLLDISQSMLAQDFQPNRLERAKFKIKDLLKEDLTANTGLIAYGGTAHLTVPATSDRRLISDYLDALSPKLLQVKGSNLELAISLADSITPKDSPLTVLIVSDSPNLKDYNTIQKFTSEEKHQVFYMPVSTINGAEVPGFRRGTIMKDKNGKVVRSKLNTGVIKKISELENAYVLPVVLDNTDIKLIVEKLKRIKEFNEDDKKQDEWKDSGYVLIVLLIFLSLFWFRKGFRIASVVFLMFSTSCSNVDSFEDLWYSKDYQGQILYDEEEFEASAEVFVDHVRKGNAYYKNGNFDLAIEEYSQDTTATSLYNLGLSYIKTGNYNEALAAFDLASQKDSTFKDAYQSKEKLQNWMTDNLPKESLDSLKKNNIEEKGRGEPTNDDESLDDANQEIKKLPKDMDNRLSDEVESNVRKGKESEDMPEFIDNSKEKEEQAKQVLIRKISSDPEVFLKRKFQYQQRKYYKNIKQGEELW